MTTTSFDYMWELLAPVGEFIYRERACRRLWETFNIDKQHEVYRRIRDKKRRGETVNPNPYFAIINNVDDGTPTAEPTDWNGQHAPEPTEIACYNGHWGMYTLSDIQLFNLQTKSKK